jgi:hypothetical protein
MRRWIWLAFIAAILLAGCTSGPGSLAESPTRPEPPRSTEVSAGAGVPADNPALPRVDSAGNTAQEVLLAYVRAQNRSDWRTVYSLVASPTGDYASFARRASEYAVPWDDFKMYETRIVSPNKALVRVSYSTIGFSALEGQSPERSRRVVVVRAPGEWWVLEKGQTDDAVWRVTSKAPHTLD